MEVWEEKLNNYKTDPDAAIQEVLRAKQVWDNESKAGAGQERLSQISNWAQQVRDAAGLSNENYGAGVNRAAATGNYINSLTAKAYTRAPEYQLPTYKPPQVSIISLAAAQKQARGEIDPMTRAMTDRTNRMYQEQRERLPMLLNARGRVFGGGRIAGEGALTQQHSQDLTDLDLKQQAAIMELARAIQNRSEEQSRQQLADAYNQWLGQTQLGMQKWQTDVSQHNADATRASDTARALQQQGQWDKEYGLKEKQWLASPEAQSDYLDLWRQKMNADISATSRSGYGGGGGGGGGGSSKTPSLYDQAKAAAYNDPRLYTGKVDERNPLPEGKWTLDELISAYMSQLGGGEGAPSGDGGVQAMIQQARANGYSDAEIRQEMINDGYNPSQYGL